MATRATEKSNKKWQQKLGNNNFGNGKNWQNWQQVIDKVR